jgi:hypothetical protein
VRRYRRRWRAAVDEHLTKAPQAAGRNDRDLRIHDLVVIGQKRVAIVSIEMRRQPSVFPAEAERGGTNA